MMTYIESAEGIVISRERAIRELDKQGLLHDLETFLTECGDKAEYLACDVLEWCGY